VLVTSFAAIALKWRLLHADAEPVLQFIERGESAFLERLIPQTAQRLPGWLVITAEQARRLGYRTFLEPDTVRHRRFLIRAGPLPAP
jgi:hypothetical protein